MRHVLASLAMATVGCICTAGPAPAQNYSGSYFAVVKGADGETVRSSGVKGTRRNGPGSYSVTFARSLLSCAYTASITGAVPGIVTTAPNNNKPTRLTVRTFAVTGISADQGFAVMVECAPGAAPN